MLFFSPYRWFSFDGFLVALMLLETLIIPVALTGADGSVGQLGILRLLRLLRLTRMVRLMRAVPELVTLLRSMVIALRSVLSTLGLLFMFMYVFAIIIKSQLRPGLALYPRSSLIGPCVRFFIV